MAREATRYRRLCLFKSLRGYDCAREKRAVENTMSYLERERAVVCSAKRPATPQLRTWPIVEAVLLDCAEELPKNPKNPKRRWDHH